MRGEGLGRNLGSLAAGKIIHEAHAPRCGAHVFRASPVLAGSRSRGIASRWTDTHSQPGPRGARPSVPPATASLSPGPPSVPARFGELQHEASALGGGVPGLWPPAHGSLCRESSVGGGSSSGPELGAEASFLSLSCHWGPLRAWRGAGRSWRGSACPPPPRGQAGQERASIPHRWGWARPRRPHAA